MNKTYFIKCIDNNDFNWESIPTAFINENGWNSLPKYESSFQIVFIKEYGFILKLTTNEPNPWANYKNDNDPVYLDSCLEAFLMFDGERYINLETNSSGARLQAIGANRFNRLSILNFDIKVKTERKDDGWSIIIDLPLNKLCNIFNIKKEDFVSGYKFKGNFYKTGKNPDSNLEHYYMWNRVETLEPDFHQSKYFGTLILN